MESEESKALRMSWYVVFNEERTNLPEERYHRQQEHVERDKSLNH
jgi:hypothetical protein